MIKVTHGKYQTNIYRVWLRMKQRCQNPNFPSYHNYGGRGIKVSDSWQEFKNFYRDMGDKPTPKHTLERVDNDGDYSKENCRWATRKEQANNRRTCVYITHKGKTQTIMQWAEETGLEFQTLSERIQKWNWPIEKALYQPLRHIGCRKK